MPVVKFYLRVIAGCYLCLISYQLKAQTNNAVPRNIKSADSLYLLKLYKNASTFYFKAFKTTSNQTTLNLFNAARACSRAHYRDSAYRFLYIIISRGDAKFYDNILYEPDFMKLHRDKRWAQLISEIETQSQMFKTPVAAELIAMRKHRIIMELKQSDILKQYNDNSTLVKAYRDSTTKLDSIDALKLKSIINTYGWPGPKNIGDDGLSALIYLFQKTNFSIQKRYFPLINEAFKRGEIDAGNYAIIADKISLFDTGKQIYGTQSSYHNNLITIEGKDSVNKRRAFIGLSPLP